MYGDKIFTFFFTKNEEKYVFIYRYMRVLHPKTSSYLNELVSCGYLKRSKIFTTTLMEIRDLILDLS